MKGVATPLILLRIEVGRHVSAGSVALLDLMLALLEPILGYPDSGRSDDRND
jgi:hypothetical protein